MIRLLVVKKLLFIILLFCMMSASAQTEKLKIDHAYSPEWWQSLICLPDDPVKTLVGREGQLFGDYGYDGGPRLFSFSLQLDSKDPSQWKSQELPSARVPMTYTKKESNGLEILEQTFLQIPGEQRINTIQRSDSRRVERGWSKPTVPCDSAFMDIASGLKGLSGEGLVEFQVKVKPGAAFSTALGFCEGQLDTAGQRVMRIYVEGAPYKDIDVIKDFGAKTPGVYFFEGRDVNNDGVFNIIVTNKPGALIRDAFINGIWLFNGKAPSAANIIAGKENKNAVLYARAAGVRMPERQYHILATIKNESAGDKNFEPVIRYVGTDKLSIEGQNVYAGDHTYISFSDPLVSTKRDSATGYSLLLKPVLIKRGETKNISVMINRFLLPGAHPKASVAISKQELNKSFAWWTKNSPAVTAISVPDSGIQAIVESSLRNIFQAREIRKGNKSFHVGPTQYRGLWIADGSFLLETATMLDYVKDVRSCIDYLTSYQLPDGGFEMIPTFHKENGLVLFMLTRHAMLTQDKKWMEANWSVIEGCIKRINHLRELAMQDSTKPYYTLLPDGNVDGGIQHGNDYSNTEWCLGGMKWAIWAANWLGKKDEAKLWQNQYDDFYAKFMKLAKQDLRKDEFGNTYLPVLIKNEQDQAPQKGQWAFCQSVYPGQIFDDNDSALQMARNTVEMLHDHRQEGLVINTGWMEQGLWTYFASFYGHALQWLGRGSEIPSLLYSFGNHSSPTMVWREEQKPKGKGNDEVGDMPHNWASAEFIRMVVHMIQLDHGNDLHLFEGLPAQWTAPNSATKLNGLRTPFGRMDLSFTINAKGNEGTLKLNFLDAGNLPKNIVIHRESWNPGSANETIPGAAQVNIKIAIK